MKIVMKNLKENQEYLKESQKLALDAGKGFATECCDGKTILDSCKSSTDLSKSGTGRSSISAATIAAVVYIAHLLGN